MITVLRTALFREIKVCLIGRNGRACSQSFYQENILIIKTFCPFVLLSKIIIVLLLLCLKTCSSVENSAFREMNGKSTGNLRDMFEQHIPLVKPFTHRHFTRFTGYVDKNGQSFYYFHTRTHFIHPQNFTPFSCIFPKNTLSLPLNSLIIGLFPNTPS